MSIQEIAYREATRSIAQQQAVLDNIRGRAGLLFSAASVATAFLGGEALADEALPGLVWLAVVLYLVVLLITVAILWPYTFHFSFDAKTIVEGYADRTDEDAYGHLARYLDKQYEGNDAKVRCLLNGLQLAVVVLAADVVCWLAVLAIR